MRLMRLGIVTGLLGLAVAVGLLGAPVDTSAAPGTSRPVAQATATPPLPPPPPPPPPNLTPSAGPSGTPTATPPAPPAPPNLGGDPASSAPYRLYAPIAYRAAGAWDSGMQVQNTGGADVTVFVSFFQQGQIIATEAAATVGAGASRTYYLPALTGVPPGFAGSAVIGASGPVAAVVNSTNYNINGSGKSSTTAYNAVNLSDAATTVAVPGLRYGSLLSVQNASAQSATVRVTNYNEGGLVSGSQDIQLGAGAASTVDLGFARSAAGGNAVSAVVTATDGKSPLAVVLFGDIAGSAGTPGAVSFPGVPRTAPNLVAPLVMKRPTGWATELAIQNLGSATAQVAIQYYDATGNAVAGANESFFIPANGAALSQQAANQSLVGDFVGSAVVSSTNGQPLALAAVQKNANLNQATNYIGQDVGAASTTLFAPLLMKAHNGWNTGMQVQNVGTGATSVTVTYYDANNQLVSSQASTVQPNTAATFYTPDAPGLPADFVGSAVVTSAGGQKLVGVVNEVNYVIGNGGDNSLTYSLVPGQ